MIVTVFGKEYLTLTCVFAVVCMTIKFDCMIKIGLSHLVGGNERQADGSQKKSKR